MLKTHELLEKRARLTEEAKAILAAPGGADGYLSTEQEQRHKALADELGRLDATIKAQAMQDELDRRAAGTPISGSGDNRLDLEFRKFSLVKAIAGAAGLGVDWGRERELQGELAKRQGKPAQGILVPMQIFERRVITTALPETGAGASLIGTDHLGGQLIDILRARLVVNRLGARVLNGLVGDVAIPRLNASTTAAWVADNAAIPASDAAFGAINMSPHHVGAISEFSRNMLLQSSPDIEQLLRSDMAQVLAEAVDRVAIAGGGAHEPDGILATSGIGAVAMGTDGGAVDSTTGRAKIIDLVAALANANADSGALAYLSNSRVQAAAMKAIDGEGRPLGLPNIFPGYPLAVSNLVPSNLTKGSSVGVCSAVIFGNFSDLILGYWSVLDVLVNPYESTAYSKGNVQVRAMLSMDLAVRHPESFAAIKDITTA